MTAQTLFSDFLALLFPNYCFGCHDGLVQGEDILCTSCIAELPRLNYYESDDNPITNRFIGRVNIKHGWALFKFQKTGIVQNLLHELKYNHHPEIGIKLGKILAFNLLTNGHQSEFDIIIPIPLHKSKKRIRGYNQSAMIAQGLQEILGIPFDDTLVERVLPTKTQTKKSRAERWDNMSMAFYIRRPGAISGKRILIIDDVITTGSTIESCATTLQNSGAKEISVASLAEVL